MVLEDTFLGVKLDEFELVPTVELPMSAIVQPVDAVLKLFGLGIFVACMSWIVLWTIHILKIF